MAPLIRAADHRGPSPSPPSGTGTVHAPTIDRTKNYQHFTAAQRTPPTVTEKVPAWARPQVQNSSSTRQLVRRASPAVRESVNVLQSSGTASAAAPPPTMHSSTGNLISASARVPTTPTLSTPTLSSGNGFGALSDVDNSPSSTVDLHGATCLRTPSAPDSLLSGPGGLELSDSLSHPSLTVSTNSSTNQAVRLGDCTSQLPLLSAKIAPPLSPIAPTVAPTQFVRAAPSACHQDIELDTSIPQLALCAESDSPSRGEPDLALCSESDIPGRRTPEAVSSAKKEPSSIICESPELLHEATKVPIARDGAARFRPHCKLGLEEEVGDENMPPSQEVQQGVATALSGKLQDKEAVQGAAASGRSEKIAKMCSYWEARMMANQSEPALTRPNHSDSGRIDALGGSLRERSTHTPQPNIVREVQPNILRERCVEAPRENAVISSPTPQHLPRDLRDRDTRSLAAVLNASSASPSPQHLPRDRDTRSVSAALPRRPGAESRRCQSRIAQQQQLQDDLTALMQVVCPCESEGIRSSGSESEPLAQEPREDHDDWFRVVERENRILNKHLRQYTRLLTHYLRKRSTSCGPIICPSCSVALACPECGRTHSDISRNSRGREKVRMPMTRNPAMSSFTGGQVPPAALRERVDADNTDIACNIWQRSTSPTSPPTVQEEEPAGEPDSGLLSN
jgi:predicted RNA-binding Zn-ribbon protein involved in translation (DUF1610 family)